MLLGIALPDLLGNFSTHYNQIFKESSANQYTAEEWELVKGIQKHYLLDAIFHDSPLFIAHCQYMKQALLATSYGTKIPRIFMVSHILVELLLDRYLIQREPALLDAFYNQLKQGNPAIIQAVFNKYPATQNLSGKAIARLQHFLEFHYLRMYAKQEHIVTAIQKITQFHFSWTLSQTENEELGQLLHDYGNKYGNSDFFSIFEYLTKQLNLDCE